MTLTRRLMAGVPPRVAFATFSLGGVLGLLAGHLGLPLPMMLGSMLGVALASGLGVRIGGMALAVPQAWRNVMVPIIGVSIGAGFPPDILDALRQWWLSIALLFVVIPLAQLIAFGLYRRVGRLDRATAFFAAMPGGFIEAIEMADKARADHRMVISLQLLRLILSIVLIPVGFSITAGHVVGSASGIALPGSGHALDAFDIAVLIALGASGWFLGTMARLPAAVMFGPLLVSAAAHSAGLTEAAPPGWSILVAQWVLGTTLGCRLAGLSRAQLTRAFGLSVLNTTAMLTLAAGVAALFHARIGEPEGAVILAFAPGGVTEMSLVALSLHLSAVYVSVHHMLRILIAVVAAKALQGPVVGR
ncbi:MAG: AbrB family transcriptional regulator [Pararhodobacter sp.]